MIHHKIRITQSIYTNENFLSVFNIVFRLYIMFRSNSKYIINTFHYNIVTKVTIPTNYSYIKSIQAFKSPLFTPLEIEFEKSFLSVLLHCLKNLCIKVQVSRPSDLV